MKSVLSAGLILVSTGCFNRGRASLIEAQRYPEDFDGIAAEVPAMACSETSPAVL